MLVAVCGTVNNNTADTAYGKEMVQFIDAIENDTETPLGVEDGLKPVLMGLAAKKSVEEGRPVKISEIEF